MVYVKYLWYTNNTSVHLLGWSLKQLYKSSYKVHNNFLKAETKFIMMSQGQHNDLANTWNMSNIALIDRLHTECLKSNKNYKATS